MIVLALNCGSSSVKFRLADVARDAPDDADPRELAGGIVTGLVGGDAVLRFRVGGPLRETPVAARDHGEAVRAILAGLGEHRDLPPVGAVGHRVVHGGPALTAPARVDASVLAALEALEEVAPLHNAPSVAGIRAARDALGPAVPMVAAFDTAFHAMLPPEARAYAVPADLAARHGIRRFGFHGLSYQSALAGYRRLAGVAPEHATLVALHLGNGCSAVAIRDGRSVDTSMGFTPLEGLVMGTRAGDLDPALVGYLARRERVPVATVDEWLNTRAGLLGLSELSHDMRILLAREGDHVGARLAIAVFCYRARKYVGAYFAALGGAQALVFTGAIGANAPEIRRRICAGLEWCGIRLDPTANAEAVGVPARIGLADGGAGVYAIPTDEEAVIARETGRVLAGAGR